MLIKFDELPISSTDIAIVTYTYEIIVFNIVQFSIFYE